MNKRIRLTVIFSAQQLPYQAVVDWLAPRVGRKFAGACCVPVDGIWSEDGDDHKSQYQNGRREQGVKLLVSVMPEQKQQAIADVRDLLQELKVKFKLPITWVHVESEEVIAGHFKLAD